MMSVLTGGWPDKLSQAPTYIPIAVDNNHIENVDQHIPGGGVLASKCTAKEPNTPSMKIVQFLRFRTVEHPNVKIRRANHRLFFYRGFLLFRLLQDRTA